MSYSAARKRTRHKWLRASALPRAAAVACSSPFRVGFGQLESVAEGAVAVAAEPTYQINLGDIGRAVEKQNFLTYNGHRVRAALSSRLF